MEYFLEKPEQIKISLTSVCNFRCTMCFNPNLKEQKGFIEDSLLFKILDECKSLDIRKVSLGSTGEVLLHKNFLNYLKYAKLLGLWVSTTTNCSFLTENIAEALIQEKIDRINLSIYSSDPQEHRAYTDTDTFERVVTNIHYFLDLWHKTGGKIEVRLRYLQVPNVNDYDKFMKFWKPLAKKVGLSIPVKRVINWSGRVSCYSEKELFGGKHEIPCPHIRYYLHILHNGDVLPCTSIPESYGAKEVLFGNVLNDRIIDIWNNQKYLSFKKAHAQMKVSDYGPCQNCSDRFEKSATPLRKLFAFLKK